MDICFIHLYQSLEREIDLIEALCMHCEVSDEKGVDTAMILRLGQVTQGFLHHKSRSAKICARMPQEAMPMHRLISRPHDLSSAVWISCIR